MKHRALSPRAASCYGVVFILALGLIGCGQEKTPPNAGESPRGAILWFDQPAFSIEDLDHAWSQRLPLPDPDDTLTMVDDGGQDRLIATLKDYATAIDAGWVPKHTYDIAMASHAARTVHALLFLSRAAPAADAGTVFIPYPTELPGRIFPDPAQYHPAEQTWGELFAEDLAAATITTDDDRSWLINGAMGMDIGVHLLASGDISDNGQADILVMVSAHVTEGSYRSFTFHILDVSQGSPARIID